jgi:hypothetical protein
VKTHYRKVDKETRDPAHGKSELLPEGGHSQY